MFTNFADLANDFQHHQHHRKHGMVQVKNTFLHWYEAPVTLAPRLRSRSAGQPMDAHGGQGEGMK